MMNESFLLHCHMLLCIFVVTLGITLSGFYFFMFFYYRTELEVKDFYSQYRISSIV